MGEIPVHQSRNNLLDFPDFCRINKLIKKYTHPILVPTLKKLIDLRRDALFREDEDLYRRFALKFTQVEEFFTSKISDEVLNHFELEQQTFFESWQYGLNEDARNDSVLAA